MRKTFDRNFGWAMILAEFNTRTWDIGINFCKSGKYHVKLKVAFLWAYICIYLRIKKSRHKNYEADLGDN